MRGPDAAIPWPDTTRRAHGGESDRYTPGMTKFELSASVALWRGRTLLLMKRTGGVGAGGWFLPGGHLEESERPVEAAVREVFEETGIALDPAGLSLADVMSYASGAAIAHNLVYNALAPDGVEAVVNDEHFVARWYEPQAAIDRFYEESRLRALNVPEDAIELAAEVARVLRSAMRARGVGAVSDGRPIFGGQEADPQAGDGATLRATDSA